MADILFSDIPALIHLKFNFVCPVLIFSLDPLNTRKRKKLLIKYIRKSSLSLYNSAIKGQHSSNSTYQIKFMKV